MTTMSSGAVLERLMVIAGLYAHKLAADAGPPSSVLILERDGELACAILDGWGQDLATQVRGLLARGRATSAVVVVRAQTVVAGTVQSVYCILGETDEGGVAVRRYRARRRRLTLLTDGDELEIEGLLRPLFPVHRASVTVEVLAAPASSADTTSEATTSERIVAA
jgi:hypothetical protein